MDIARFFRGVRPPLLDRIVRRQSDFGGAQRILPIPHKHFRLDPYEPPALCCGLEESIPGLPIEVNDV